MGQEELLNYIEDVKTDIEATLQKEYDAVVERYTEREFATPPDWGAGNPTLLETSCYDQHVYEAMRHAPKGIYILDANLNTEYSFQFPALELPSYNLITEVLSSAVVRQIIKNIADFDVDFYALEDGVPLFTQYETCPIMAYRIDPVPEYDHYTLENFHHAYLVRHDGVWSVFCKNGKVRALAAYQQGLLRLLEVEDFDTAMGEFVESMDTKIDYTKLA
jgi:hypothetical protein